MNVVNELELVREGREQHGRGLEGTGLEKELATVLLQPLMWWSMWRKVTRWILLNLFLFNKLFNKLYQ